MKAYREHSADDIMNSIRGMQPAVPPASLFSRIEQRVQAGYTVARTIPLWRVSVAAACILLLIVANVFILSKQNTPSTHTQDPLQSMASYYGLTDNMEAAL